jgi:hypothetical protein
MNRKASLGEILMNNAIYIILSVVFFVGMFLFIMMQMNGAQRWSQYYSQEIVKIIESSEPNTTISLDVHKATGIAIDNEIQDINEIFQFDDNRNEVCVKLSQGKKSCYFYFNQVNIINKELKLAQGPKADTNVLIFKITDRVK